MTNRCPTAFPTLVIHHFLLLPIRYLGIDIPRMWPHDSCIFWLKIHKLVFRLSSRIPWKNPFPSNLAYFHLIKVAMRWRKSQISSIEATCSVLRSAVLVPLSCLYLRWMWVPHWRALLSNWLPTSWKSTVDSGQPSSNHFLDSHPQTFFLIA